MNKRFISNPGSHIKPVRAMRIFDDGSSAVVKVGEENVQEFIQSFEPSTNVRTLIARFSSGDLSVVSSTPPTFGDFTALPKTLTDAMQMIIDGQRYFDSLPLEVKQRFGMDYNVFLAQSSEPDFVSKLGLQLSSVSLAEDKKVEDLVNE